MMSTRFWTLSRTSGLILTKLVEKSALFWDPCKSLRTPSSNMNRSIDLNPRHAMLPYPKGVQQNIPDRLRLCDRELFESLYLALHLRNDVILGLERVWAEKSTGECCGYFVAVLWSIMINFARELFFQKRLPEELGVRKVASVTFRYMRLRDSAVRLPSLPMGVSTLSKAVPLASRKKCSPLGK